MLESESNNLQKSVKLA